MTMAAKWCQGQRPISEFPGLPRESPSQVAFLVPLGLSQQVQPVLKVGGHACEPLCAPDSEAGMEALVNGCCRSDLVAVVRIEIR